MNLFGKNKKVEKTGKKKKTTAKEIVEPSKLLEHYAYMVNGQIRGVINERARELNLESISWGLLNMYNLGLEYGKEEGRREILSELAEREERG